MGKLFYISTVIYLATLVDGLSQSSASFPSTDQRTLPEKESWQRLNLMLSSTFWHVAKEGQVDLNSSLLYASRSLGISRIFILGEGIDDPELLSQSAWIDQKKPAVGNNLAAKASGRARLVTLLLLGSYYVFEPLPSYKRDSAEYFISKVLIESGELKDKKIRRLALCQLAKMNLDINNTKRADSIFNLLIKECARAGDKKTEARAHEYIGLYTRFSPANTQERIDHLQKATALYRSMNIAEGQINALTDIGYLHVVSGRLQDAYSVFTEALKLGESIKYPYIHYNTDALAMVTAFQGKFGEPFKYALQTVKISETNRDSLGWGYFYSRLSGLYDMEGGRDKEKQESTKKAFDRFILDKDPALYGMLTGLIDPMTRAGRSKDALKLVSSANEKIPPSNFSERFWYHLVLSSCYEGLNELALATRHLSIADSLETEAEVFRGPLRRAFIYIQQAHIHKKKGEFALARSVFEKYLVTDSPARALGNDIDAYRNLVYLDDVLNDPASGLRHCKKFVMLVDSNYRVSKVRQAEELQVMYLTQEKESQITLLNQQARVEQANLKQAMLTRNMTIAGIIAVMVIAILLYRQNRLRKMTNQVVTKQNDQLHHLLTEKEWLLKEIHHRVKNNLQIVMSLLNSQSAFIDNETALTAIHDSQHRVHAMSLIHQKLYSRANVSSIEMSSYIRELVTYLAESFKSGQRIHFEFALEPLEIDVSQAVPLGLILNESITNAIKYAFPKGRDGIISIFLSKASGDQYLLAVADNGTGMPSKIIENKPGTLGMSLMEGLSEDLNGKFSIESGHSGTVIKVSFVYDQTIKRTKHAEEMVL